VSHEYIYVVGELITLQMSSFYNSNCRTFIIYIW